jgi:superfamily II DNA or RNA helicase
LFDEGIDVKPLDTLVLAAQGKSAVRAMQRVGRVLRLSPETNKDKCTVVDFAVNERYLSDHALSRQAMYATEPEFEISEIGPNYE